MREYEIYFDDLAPLAKEGYMKFMATDNPADLDTAVPIAFCREESMFKIKVNGEYLTNSDDELLLFGTREEANGYIINDMDCHETDTFEVEEHEI